jgi:hypothetical protein
LAGRLEPLLLLLVTLWLLVGVAAVVMYQAVAALVVY